jgi:POT family proton-dependent oligopeptide transporter
MPDQTISHHAAVPATSIQGHPKGLYVLFMTEMWERFSYYGMRALLILFMVAAAEKGGLGFSEPTAAAIYGLYTALVYLVALPGGWIADHLLGARRSVWYGGIIIAAGHFTLAIPSTHAFFFGLWLIIVGTGLLKPNISAIVGELYPEGGARHDSGFTIFYMGVNLGATLGSLICAQLGEKVNWHYGFAAAGVGMVLGLLQYRFAGRHLGEAGLHPRRRKGAAAHGIDKGWFYVAAGMAIVVVVTALAFAGVIRFDPILLAKKTTYLIFGLGAAYLVLIFLFGHLDATEKKRMVVLIVLLLASAMFWSGFEQAGSTFNLFAKDYTQRAVKSINFVIPAGWFQMINSIFIIALAPVMASLWLVLARRGVNLSIPVKFALGLILLGAGFLVMVGASKLIGPGKQVLPTWLIATYLLHTLGELCLSPVGLSAVTKLAPSRFVGQMLGLWFLSASLGNLIAGLIAGQVASSSVEQMPQMYLRIVLTTAGSGVILLLLARPLRKLMGDVR